MKQIFRLVVVSTMLFGLFGFDNHNDCRNYGLIVGADSKRCGCCGGYEIEIGPDLFLIDSFPNREEILGKDYYIDYPIAVYLDYEKAKYCKNRIKITCIRKR